MSRSLAATLIGATLTTATALSLAASPASAAVDPGDRVYARNLPTTAQAAESYPVLWDGHRYVQSGPTTTKRAADCLSYDDGPRAASGKWAYYTDASDQSPYFSGKADPVVFVWKYPTVAEAGAAFATIWSSYRDCFGTATDADFTVESHGVPVPDLASRSRAWRSHETQPSSDDHFLTQLTRKGRYLVETRVQADGFVPAKAPLVDLTRTTLRKLP